jgi:hypothetical protein
VRPGKSLHSGDGIAQVACGSARWLVIRVGMAGIGCVSPLQRDGRAQSATGSADESLVATVARRPPGGHMSACRSWHNAAITSR